MNYIQLAFAPEELGFVPQDNGTTDEYEQNHPDSVRRAYDRHPIGNLLLPAGIKFRPQSKFTDVLRLIEVGFPFLVVSDRFWRSYFVFASLSRKFFVHCQCIKELRRWITILSLLFSDFLSMSFLITQK